MIINLQKKSILVPLIFFTVKNDNVSMKLSWNFSLWSISIALLSQISEYKGLYIFIQNRPNVLHKYIEGEHKPHLHVIMLSFNHQLQFQNWSSDIAQEDRGDWTYVESVMCLSWRFVIMDWGNQYSILTSWDMSYVQQLGSLYDDLQNTTSMFFHVCTVDYSRLSSWGQPFLIWFSLIWKQN